MAAALAWQPSLLDSGEPTIDVSYEGLLELRLTAGWSTSAQHVPPLLAEMCLLLSGRYDVGFDSVWVNPQDGASGRCAHGGDHPPFQAASQRR